MTVEQYIESNGMTQKAFCQLTGIPMSSLSNYLTQNGNISTKYAKRLKELGIEYDAKSEKRMNGFDHFKAMVQYTVNGTNLKDTFYCYSEEQINYMTEYLNKKKIAYYSYLKDYYWVVKYDKREEWIESVDLVN